jgi:hypothetical protein
MEVMMSDEPAPYNPFAFYAPDPDVQQPGMFLRDWFAGQVIGDIASEYGPAVKPEAIANRAYALADAMLRERVK